MITIQTKQQLEKLLVWFRGQILFPKAVLTQVDYETNREDTALNIVRVSFQGMFVIGFYGTTIELEDICRCHSEEIAAQKVRGMIAAFLRHDDTFKLEDGTLWDELDTYLKEDIVSFANYFR